MAYPGGMFGAPVGISSAEADNRAVELHRLAMDKGEVELQQAQLTLQSQKQMLDLMKQATASPTGNAPQGPQAAMSQLAGDSTDTLASSMDQMSVIALRSGMFEKAKDFAVAGSTIRHNAAQIQKDRSEQMIKELDLVGSLMERVHDQASWQQANAMYQMQTGKESPYSRLPYNPTVVEELRNGVASAKDRALTSAAKAREKASEATEAERRARIPLIRAQTTLAQERADALRKAGAVTKIPKAGDVRAITDLMTKDFGAAMLPEDMRVLARPVAERMLDIMKSQSLSQSQAAEKAYQEAKAAGDFGGIRPRVPMSGTAEKPLDLPQSKDKLRPNMYYKGKGAYEGKTMLWTGAAFVPVGNGPGEASPNEEEPDEDEDDVDEERGDLEPAKEP